METDLFEFAYVPDWYGQLEELEGLVLPEPWKFKRPGKTFPEDNYEPYKRKKQIT